jgi:hypothetical protein
LSVKHARITREDQGIPPSIFCELALLSEVNHPHIVHVSRKDIMLDSEAHLISLASEYGSVNVCKIDRLRIVAESDRELRGYTVRFAVKNACV